VGLKVSLDGVKKGKYLILPEFEIQSFAVEPVASRYND
jgi:hypothetical protein